MDIDQHIFREYDIRGIVGKQLTDEAVAVLGRAIGTFFRQNSAKRIAIGFDARESSPRFCELITRGFNQCGIGCVVVGMVPTPVLYHTVFTRDVDGGVMITGSHNPPDHNGFKICLGKDALFGSQIQEIKQIALSGSFADGSSTNENVAVLDTYINDIVSRVSFGSRKLKAVIDAGNGMGGVTAVPILEKLGVEMVKLFIEPDSDFPNHHPDPTVEENLEDLIEAVKANNADIGIAFDGDGDRIGVVDENGRIIWGDELMILLSRSVLAERPGSTIIAEVKCSQTLFDDIAAHGGTPLMWKAGHSLIKAKMKETNAALAGEMSGHIFFADRFYGFDDAAYVAARVLEILSKTDKKFSELFDDIPKTFSTPELRVDCPDDVKFDVVKQIAEHFAKTNDVITIDGARINFENGWGLVRASNTQAILVLRFEADSEEALQEIRTLVESEVDTAIAPPFLRKMPERKNFILCLLLAAAVLPYWIGIGDSTLWDANEAFYAETPRVTIETGDYISPSFNAKPRFNKPPLTYWIVAASYGIFGVSEWSERLPIVLAAMGLIAAAFVIGRVVWGTQTGLWAAIVMATLPRFLMHSRRTSIDVFLTLFMGLTLMFFVLSELRPERRKLWLCLMYASVGLGFMTKGPVAVVLPAAAFLIYLIVEKRLRDIGKMMVPAGLAIFSVIVVPWYLLVYQRHGWDYIVSFILNENISRYTDEGWGPRRSFFYLGTMIGDLFPWSILLIAALVFVIFRRKFGERIFGETGFPYARLMAIWTVVIVGFYSLSRNQQDQYMMPTYLAASVLVGALIASSVEKYLSSVRWIFLGMGVLLSAVGGALLYLNTSGSSIDLAGIGTMGIVLLISGIAVLVFAAARKSKIAAYSQALAVAAVMWIFVLFVLPDFERYKPVKALSEVIAQNAGPEARVGYYRYTAPTMVFYLHRSVLEYFHENEIIDLFADTKPAYMIMPENEYDAIKPKLTAPTRIIATRPLLRIRLNEPFSERKEPHVVLVTNEKVH